MTVESLRKVIDDVLFEAYVSPRQMRDAKAALEQLADLAGLVGIGVVAPMKQAVTPQTTMKQVIRKFPVPSLLGNSPAIQMPAGAQILSVGPHVTATTDAAVWALVSEAEPVANRTILFLQTDAPTSEKPLAFIGTVVLGSVALHFFDMGET